MSSLYILLTLLVTVFLIYWFIVSNNTQYSILNTQFNKSINSRSIPKLYLIGDSHTERGYRGDAFVTKLSNEYIRKLDVVNRGFSGYTSEHLRVMLPQLLHNDNTPQGSIHTATILLGSNDAVRSNWHVPVHRYKENIEFIIKILKGAGIKNILLISPPPVDDEAKFNYSKQKHGAVKRSLFNKDVKMYADVCKDIAVQQQTHFIDMYSDMMLADNWKNYLIDGLHFTSSGYMFLFDKVKKVLDPLLQPLPFLYPLYPPLIDLEKKLL